MTTVCGQTARRPVKGEVQREKSGVGPAPPATPFLPTGPPRVSRDSAPPVPRDRPLAGAVYQDRVNGAASLKTEPR